MPIHPRRQVAAVAAVAARHTEEAAARQVVEAPASDKFPVTFIQRLKANVGKKMYLYNLFANI